MTSRSPPPIFPCGTSSPKSVRYCGICNKPFLNENSYIRHTSYCRRALNRPRTRTRSCRACSIAKAKCSFHPRCLRCASKNLTCVYETTTTTTTAVANLGQQISTPIATPAPSLAGGDLSLEDAFAGGDSLDSHDSTANLDQDLVDFATPNSFTAAHSQRADFVYFDDSATKIIPREPQLLSNAGDGRHDVDDHHHGNFVLDSPTVSQLPWSSSTMSTSTWSATATACAAVQDDSLTMAEYECLQDRADIDFLARIPRADSVACFTATAITQMLLAFPQMMLRRETLPPFVHGHWYRRPGATGLALPEPLINCMGIVQIFAAQNPDSRPFLWRTVQSEQRAALQKLERDEISRGDHLATIQAHLIYILMRVFDSSKADLNFNFILLQNFAMHCESFSENEPFGRDERLYPSATWEDWILAESRRRTVILWFLLAQTVRVKTGLGCKAVMCDFRNLPLCSSKTLWEASTHAAWQSEYERYRTGPRVGLERFGDLIDACRQGDVAANRIKMNTWNAETDNLGMLLGLSVAMV